MLELNPSQIPNDLIKFFRPKRKYGNFILRNVIIWYKRNCMPASVRDRFTVDYEFVFFFVKNKKYYFEQQFDKANYDGRKDMIMKGSEKYANGYFPTDVKTQTIAVKGHKRWATKYDDTDYGGNGTGFQGYSGYNKLSHPFVRNKRCVWSLAPEPMKDAHFATFPQKLIEPMIRAGCPEFVCKKCGKAREKIYEKGELVSSGPNQMAIKPRGFAQNKLEIQNLPKDPYGDMPRRELKEVGLTDCGCNAGFEGGIVYDPFMGSGTTALVAKKLGRNYIGSEINPDYVKIAEKRLIKEIHFKEE